MEKSIFDIEAIEGLEVGEDFYLDAKSPPRLPQKHRTLLDCRLKLLLKESQVFGPGEMKMCNTTLLITPKHGWNLSTRANPEVGLHFTEEFLRDRTETYRVRVQMTNLHESAKFLPQHFCIGYLIMM